MLAHLSLPLPHSSRRVWSLALLAVLGVGAERALAADALPLGSLDARATGNVSSGDVAPAGTMSSGLRFDGAEAAVRQSDLKTPGAADSGSSAADKNLLRDANRASLFLGAALTSSMELSLGVHGTYEHVRPEDRDALFPEGASKSDRHAGAIAWRQNLKQTGFASASLLLKMKLVDWQGLKLAVAPFIESGAGEQATYALTRSVGPKAGFVTIATYGTEGVAEATVNGGYRYRDPETLGDVTLRNELFYRADLKAYASHDFALFIAGDARKIMVAKNDDLDQDGKLQYRPRESGEVAGGATVKAGDAEFAAYYGSRLNSAKSFGGFGEKSFGASIAWTLGNYKGARTSRQSYASEIEKEIDDDQRAELKNKPATKPVAPAAAPTEQYPEMIGKDIDPLEAIGEGGDDDFKDVKKRIEDSKKDAGKESEDERIDRELSEIKAAEAKAEAERLKQEDEEKDAARHEAIKNAKEDDGLMKEWMNEAKKQDNDDAITPDEMEWNGLE